MNTEELMKKIITLGADEDGIHDRFGNDSEMYARCFKEFLEESNFTLLDAAISKKDYKSAFGSAHALKGVSGNLGLTAFYNAICALVESLRSDKYNNIPSEYAEVRRQLSILNDIFSEQPKKRLNKIQKADIPANDKKHDWKKHNKQVLLSCLVSSLLVVVIILLFFRINIDYQKNILKESGQHLTKTSNQIKQYVSEHIEYNWKLLYSLEDDVSTGNHFENDAAILKLLEDKQTIWDISDFFIYTETGYCTNSDGEVVDNARASDIAAEVITNGKLLSFIDSSLVYTISVDTDVLYNGSKIVAISAIRNMEDFLDRMNFSYYDSNAMMYLATNNGIIISKLTHPNMLSAFNISAITNNKTIQPLTDEYNESELFSSDKVRAFLMSGGEEPQYIVSIPIDTSSIPLRLFYVESESIVNNSTNSFSDNLVLFSVFIIVLFSGFAFVMYLFLYSNRRRSFDNALKARERMLDLMIKNTKTAFALFNTDNANPDYCSGNAIDIIGDTYWNLYKNDSGYAIRNNTNTATRTVTTANKMLQNWDGKSPFRSDYIRYGQEIDPSYFVFQIYPINDLGKEFVCIAQDVTSVYLRESVVKESMELAKLASEAKSRFLSNMSHDIRTPMNAIINMSDFSLESIDQPKKLAVYLHTIHDSAEHLLHLINDVLDMSRIESGQTVITSERFNIKDEVQKKVDMIKPLCDDKNLQLIVNTDGIKSPSLYGDSLKLSQIILNLLSNAVKFTPKNGAVRLTVSEVASLNYDMANIRIKVEDTGIGISESNLKHIFEPFNRADDKRIQQIEGTGLGLSICKSYVEAMGGSIRCESEVEEGTTFTVELFFFKADPKDEKRPVEKTANKLQFLGMRCLVVEDNTINQLIAKELLERLGFIVDVADNGSDGVAKFLQSNTDTYDVIYMDIQMPIMNGYDATETIRASTHMRAKTIPIIAMTANAFEEDVKKTQRYGMDAYIVKPIVSSDLIEQTTKAINKQKGL